MEDTLFSDKVNYKDTKKSVSDTFKGVSCWLTRAFPRSPGEQKVDLKALAVWVRQTREDQGLIQEALAEMAGYTKAHISKLENERLTDPPLSLIVQICKALQKPISEPLTKMAILKSQTSEGPHLLRFINYYRDLPREDQKLVEEIIKVLWKRHTAAQPANKRKRRSA